MSKCQMNNGLADKVNSTCLLVCNSTRVNSSNPNMNKQTNQTKNLFSLISFLISFACFVFVIWQSIKCLNRFTQKPQGTSLSIENTADLPFPAITICGGSGYGYNLNELKKCSKRYLPSRQFTTPIIYFI